MLHTINDRIRLPFIACCRLCVVILYTHTDKCQIWIKYCNLIGPYMQSQWCDWCSLKVLTRDWATLDSCLSLSARQRRAWLTAVWLRKGRGNDVAASLLISGDVVSSPDDDEQLLPGVEQGLGYEAGEEGGLGDEDEEEDAVDNEHLWCRCCCCSHLPGVKTSSNDSDAGSEMFSASSSKWPAAVVE